MWPLQVTASWRQVFIRKVARSQALFAASKKHLWERVSCHRRPARTCHRSQQAGGKPGGGKGKNRQCGHRGHGPLGTSKGESPSCALKNQELCLVILTSCVQRGLPGSSLPGSEGIGQGKALHCSSIHLFIQWRFTVQ